MLDLPWLTTEIVETVDDVTKSPALFRPFLKIVENC